MEKTGLGQKSSLSFSEIIIIIAEDLFEFGVKYFFRFILILEMSNDLQKNLIYREIDIMLLLL